MDQVNEADVTQEPDRNGATKVRSETPYPYFGLTKVMEIVRAVQAVGGNSEAPAADVLAKLGITKTDRQWAYGVPAAMLFQVIERIGRGEEAKLRLTPLGLRLALPGTPEEERASKAAALRNPELYSKLLEQFAGHPLPEKDVLKRLLQRDHKIVESMAGGAAEAFLDSVRVAELLSSDGRLCGTSDSTSAPAKAGATRAELPVNPPTESEDDRQIVKVPRDFIVYKCKISKSRVIEIPLPPDFTKADVARLHAFLQTQVDDDPTG
jgi:hypothetical protein